MNVDERRKIAQEVVDLMKGKSVSGLDAIGLSAESEIAGGKNVCKHGHPTLIQSGSVSHGGWRWICADDCPKRAESI
jgi:hypothetical protein